ncbi:MAG: alkaline phosphatase PhoX [Longimicrobiales bacterium]
MSRFSRRDFIWRAAALGGGAAFAPSLRGLSAWSKDVYGAGHTGRAGRPAVSYGPLVQSEEVPELWIPQKFRVIRVSETRRPSLADPSFTVPAGVDGMAAFPLPNGNIRLIRNHELGDPPDRVSPIGARPYDALGAGGTTSLEIAVEGSGMSREVTLVREFVSLSGTHINCAGGPTPWGSWLSCEETSEGEPRIERWNGSFGGRQKDHGYIFEVPVSAESEVDPVAYKAMGRFVHEAIAVDPATGIVYETEDAYYNAERLDEMPGAGFYRFIPTRRGELGEGGRLQMLAIDGAPRYEMTRGQTPGRSLNATWVDIDDPDPTDAETRPDAVLQQGLARGAAIFNRLEGCWYGDGAIYFNSTNGGDQGAGQVWQYRPAGEDMGELVLIFESPSRDVLNSPDNICVSPRGGIVICEDSGDDEFIRGLSPEGDILDLVHQPVDPTGQRATTEFAGACFSPDGQILFFNVQGGTRSYGAQHGATYALWGPWEEGPL